LEDMARVLLAQNQIAVVVTGQQLEATQVVYTKKQCIKQARRMVAEYDSEQFNDNKISFDEFQAMMNIRTEHDMMLDHIQAPLKPVPGNPGQHNIPAFNADGTERAKWILILLLSLCLIVSIYNFANPKTPENQLLKFDDNWLMNKLYLKQRPPQQSYEPMYYGTPEAPTKFNKAVIIDVLHNDYDPDQPELRVKKAFKTESFTPGKKGSDELDGDELTFIPYDDDCESDEFIHNIVVVDDGLNDSTPYISDDNDNKNSKIRPIESLLVKERGYAMDISFPSLCSALVNKTVMIFDITNMSKPIEQTCNLLKHQLRCIATFPHQKGIAVGSVEGRCAIHYINDYSDRNMKNFAFKCHRKKPNVYAVNSIKFHKQLGTFSSAGGDGTIYFWDKDQKQKLKELEQMKLSITDVDFNYDGQLFAYAISYDWSKEIEYFKPNEQPIIYTIYMT